MQRNMTNASRLKRKHSRIPRKCTNGVHVPNLLKVYLKDNKNVSKRQGVML